MWESSASVLTDVSLEACIITVTAPVTAISVSHFSWVQSSALNYWPSPSSGLQRRSTLGENHRFHAGRRNSSMARALFGAAECESALLRSAPQANAFVIRYPGGALLLQRLHFSRWWIASPKFTRGPTGIRRCLPASYPQATRYGVVEVTNRSPQFNGASK